MDGPRSQIEADYDIRPVFIAGADRSGTTFLGDLLGAHAQCLCTPESEFIPKALIRAQAAFKDAWPTVELKEYYRLWRREWRFHIWETKVDDGFFDHGPTGRNYPKLVEHLVRQYGRRQGKADFRLWVDHTPANIKHTRLIFEMFPNAKLVHLVRDGRAVAASILPLDFGPNTVYAAASWWMRSIAFGLAAESVWGPDRIIRLNYEDILSDAKGYLEEVCRFVGVDFAPAMLSGGGFSVPDYTRHQHTLVGRPPDISRASAWRHSLSPREIEIFESTVGELLAHLGYEPVFGYGARRIKPAEGRRYALMEWYRRNFVNRKHARARRAKFKPER